MTTAFSTNTSGDLVRVAGRFVRVDSIDQRIAHKLRLIRTEWFIDRSAGVPYLSQILAKKIRIGHIRQIFRSAILSVEGVVTINELLVDFDSTTRQLAVSFRVNGGDGSTVSLGFPG